MDIPEKVRVWDWRDAPSGNFAVIGDPIGHSLSPRIHAAAYQYLELDYVYRAIRVPEGEAAEAIEALRELGYTGVNVTVPHKAAAYAWCEATEGAAVEYGVVNTLRLSDRVGVNTDVGGFFGVLESRGVRPGSRVLFLGAGGSARALIAGACAAGFQVAAWNRTRSRLVEMVTELGVDVEILDVPRVSGFHAVINATSASLTGADLPIVWEQTGSGVAFDLAYGREPSPFLDWATANGWEAVDGLEMLVEQGALAIEWWLGNPAPREAMLRSIGL